MGRSIEGGIRDEIEFSRKKKVPYQELSFENAFESGQRVKVNIGEQEVFFEIQDDNIDDEQELRYASLLDNEGNMLMQLRINLLLNEEGPGWRVYTKIEKEDKNEILPKGLGASYYEKGLDFIQHLANEKGESIHHDIFSAPKKSSGGKKLSTDRWHQIFDPIIEKYGYVLDAEMFGRPVQWTKEYTPENE